MYQRAEKSIPYCIRCGLRSRAYQPESFIPPSPKHLSNGLQLELTKPKSNSDHKNNTIYNYFHRANLKEARPVWNCYNNEREGFEDITCAASVLSEFVISPTIVANIELQAPKGLQLQTQTMTVFIIYLFIYLRQ